MSPIYEDEYLPVERDLSRKHRSRQQVQTDRDLNRINIDGGNRERERRGDKEIKPL